MKDFAVFYFWYKSLILKIVRIFVFALFFSLFAYASLSKVSPNIFLIPLSLFIILETYFHFKASEFRPENTIDQNKGELESSLSLEALSISQTAQSTNSFLTELLALPQVQFIVSKADANSKDIQVVEIDKKSIQEGALGLSRVLKGNYITTMDLFVSYLLLSETKTKFLFNRKLKTEDIKNILLWARETYVKENQLKDSEVSFHGEGVAESWIYGWTLETSKYMVDLSMEYVKKDEQPIGRVNEYKQLVEGLSKGGSVILVGDVGSGKESAVKYLAIESFMGKLQGNLYHQKIFQLMVDEFMAGANSQGELEQRLNSMMEELSHSGNVIVYVPEFQNIMGSSTFNLDISGAIIPYLKKGNIRIIAAVTPGAFKRFIEPMHSLLDTFTVVSFNEPEKTQVLDMLFRKTQEIEAKNNAILTYKAILAACEYADKYAKEKVLPGSAVVLLDDSANVAKISGKKLVSEQDVLDQVQKKTRVAVGEPKQIEKNLLLNLENELHKRVVDQVDAVSAIAEAIRRLRAGLKTAQKPISFLFLGPTGVGKTETAKALAAVYFGDVSRFIRLDMSEFSGEDGMKRLLGSPPGEGDEKGQLTEPVYDSPYSLVLLDEFEKADQKILDLFLQVLDDGRLTDNKGKTVSFVNTIIIATSNAASEFIREEVAKGTVIDKKFHSVLLNFLQTKGIFKPELLNRFDDIVTFNPLGLAEINQIVGLLLLELTKRLTEKDIKVKFDEKIVEKISKEGFDKDFGARPLRRFIQDNIEDIIAQKMLKDEIKRGDSITFSVDSSNNFILTKT